MARHTQDEDEVVLMKVATTNCVKVPTALQNVFIQQKKEFLYCTIAIKPT